MLKNESMFSFSKKNNPNNICKTDATHLLQNDITQKFIIELLIGFCKTDATHLLQNDITQKFIIELLIGCCKTDATHLLQNGITQKFIIDPRMVWNFNMSLDSHYVTHFSSGCYHKCSERFTFKQNCWILL
jgi:hypothetical protein